MPTPDHLPKLKMDGGRLSPDNIRLAHRLCNRADYSKLIGRSHARDLARVEAARQRAIEAENHRSDPPEWIERGPDISEDARFICRINWGPSGPGIDWPEWYWLRLLRENDTDELWGSAGPDEVSKRPGDLDARFAARQMLLEYWSSTRRSRDTTSS